MDSSHMFVGIFTTEVTETTEKRKAGMGRPQKFSLCTLVPSVVEAFGVDLAA
jgi:hypothetical protein